MLVEYFIIVILFPNYISFLKLKIFNNTDCKRVECREDKEKVGGNKSKPYFNTETWSL